jgi:nucleoside phosphorylase
MDNLDSILFCGSFDGETDRLSKFANLRVYNTGVGFLDTLYNLHRYLNKNKEVKSIVFLGSAGAYRHSKRKIGDLCFSNKFVYKDIAEVKNMVKVPDVINKHIMTEIDPRFDGLFKRNKFVEAVTNSTNYITLIDLEMEELVDSLYEVDLENMEAFSIAYVANRLGLNFVGLFYITNYVGANGSLDWNNNWRLGSNILQDCIIKFLF